MLCRSSSMTFPLLLRTPPANLHPPVLEKHLYKSIWRICQNIPLIFLCLCIFILSSLIKGRVIFGSDNTSGVVFVFVIRSYLCFCIFFSFCRDEGEVLIKCKVFRDPVNTFGVVFVFVSWIVFVFLSGVVFVFVCFFICGDEGEGLVKCWLFRDPAGTFGVAFVFVSWLVYVFVSGVVFVFVCLFLFLFYFYLWGWRRGTNQVQGIQGSRQHVWRFLVRGAGQSDTRN